MVNRIVLVLVAEEVQRHGFKISGLNIKYFIFEFTNHISLLMSKLLNLHTITTGNMKNRLLLLSALFLVIFGCNKNGFNTKPSIKIKSVDPTIVGVNGSMSIELEFTDKEGDISNSL